MSKAGQADIRNLLIIGAMSRLNWLVRRYVPEGSWLARMLGRKPRMLVAIALANRMAADLGHADEERGLSGSGAGCCCITSCSKKRPYVEVGCKKSATK
jgi:hypothetical protein